MRTRGRKPLIDSLGKFATSAPPPVGAVEVQCKCASRHKRCEMRRWTRYQLMSPGDAETFMRERAPLDAFFRYRIRSA